MTTSTWIVLPTAQAILFGYDAIEVTPRKAHLVKDGKRVMSAFYKTKDAGQSFRDWINFIEHANAPKYVVGGGKRQFDSLEAACAVANKIFVETGNIVSVEKVEK